jgi:hypothetical protein
MRFTSTRSGARTFSRTVQSVFTLARTVLTSSGRRVCLFSVTVN